VFHSYFGQVVTLKGVSWSCFYRQDALSISFANIFLSSRQLCVNGDRSCQWEMAIFDPPQNPHPLTDHQKNCHGWLRWPRLWLCQIWCKSVHGGLLGKRVKYNQFFMTLFWEVAYRSCPLTDFHAWWLKWCGLAKGCAICGFREIPPPQNSNLDGKILKVSYQNYCIDSNQILHNDRDHQGVIMGGPSTCPTNPRWQKPPFWKLHNFLTDFDEIWHNDTYWPRTAGRLLKFRIFENPRWLWQPSWKSQKLQYLSNNLTDLHEIMYCDAKLVFLLPWLLKNLGYIINK